MARIHLCLSAHVHLHRPHDDGVADHRGCGSHAHARFRYRRVHVVSGRHANGLDEHGHLHCHRESGSGCSGGSGRAGGVLCRFRESAVRLSQGADAGFPDLHQRLRGVAC